MNVFLYAAQGGAESEHELALRLLAMAVTQALGLPSLPEISREAGGKPFFPSRPDVCFSLSHSRGAAVCAVHNRPVGVDIEKIRSAPARLAAGMADEAFFRLWTAKEATIKRQGLGVEALLRPMEPDPLCRCAEGLLEGYIVTVCPSEEAELRTVRVESL